MPEDITPESEGATLSNAEDATAFEGPLRAEINNEIGIEGAMGNAKL